MLLRALWLVARKSLQQHRLAGSNTAFSIALATAMILTLTSLQFQAVRVFSNQTGGFDAVLGARGSALQLVLCTLYQLENSPGNLAWQDYLSIQKDSSVRTAVPIALGDNYLGYRIVGTLPQYFAAWGNGLRFQQGTEFQNEGEAVLGSWVAQQSGLKVGDSFHPSHGLQVEAGSEHSEQFRVVGLLQPTNTPQDRVILIPLEGIYRMSGHVLRGQGQEYRPQAGEAIPEGAKELSGVLLKLTSPQAGMQLDQRINREGKSATLAWPVARVVYELFSKLGWLLSLMQLTTVLVLVLVVAGASVTASLCNTLHERRREFAILRALGARRWFVAGVVTVEALWLTLVGTAWGFVLHALIMGAVTAWLRARTGIQFHPLALHPGLIVVPCGTLLLGLLSGLLPSWLVYRGSLAPSLQD